jgi:hypothetical protein
MSYNAAFLLPSGSVGIVAPYISQAANEQKENIPPDPEQVY